MSRDAQIRASVAHNKKMGSITIRPPKEVDSQIRAAAPNSEQGAIFIFPAVIDPDSRASTLRYIILVSKIPPNRCVPSGTGVLCVFLLEGSMVILGLIGGLAFSYAWK